MFEKMSVMGKWLVPLVSFFLLTGFSVKRLLENKGELMPFWEIQESSSEETIDHAAWDTFLKTYVVESDDQISRVKYSAVTVSDKKALAQYLQQLQSMKVRAYGKDEQLAYWINLYNALTVKVVLDAYPVDSIRDINLGGVFASGPWGEALLKIEGQELSLNNIEHGILRPIWKDARVHYAVNCASIGCPNLQMEAFTASNVERLLDVGAKQYINHARGVRFDKKGELHLSSIYKWFYGDFVGEAYNDKALIKHLSLFAEGEVLLKLKKLKRVESYGYDWRLNEAK